MNRQLVVIVLWISVLLAAAFGLGGAGMFGSPFGGGTPILERTVYATTIFVGPISSAAALFYLGKSHAQAGASLVLGAAVGTFLGLIVQSNFREFWGGVFALTLWLPMLVVGIKLLLYRGCSQEAGPKPKSRRLKRSRRG